MSESSETGARENGARESRTLKERILNRVFAIPAIAQWWAGKTARQTKEVVALGDAIPFTPFTGTLRKARIAIVTTAGVHLSQQPPFDMENPDGDAGYREIPDATDHSSLTITHKYYDHTDADKDLNVVFPRQRLQELAAEGIIGATGPRHFGFMGHIDGPLIQTLNEQTAPAVAGMLKQDQIDAVLLTPA